MGALVLIGGGVRSGKSAFALRQALTRGPRRSFIATAEPHDDEMVARIRRHREERADAFHTIEEPVELERAIAACGGSDVIVVDCLTLWLSNLLMRDCDEAAIAERVEGACAAIAGVSATVLVVTNEVGMGVVPPSSLGRRFRDVAGRAHQRLAAHAAEVYLATLGVVLQIAPALRVVR